jgi:hypothetical protein
MKRAKQRRRVFPPRCRCSFAEVDQSRTASNARRKPDASPGINGKNMQPGDARSWVCTPLFDRFKVINQVWIVHMFMWGPFYIFWRSTVPSPETCLGLERLKSLKNRNFELWNNTSFQKAKKDQLGVELRKLYLRSKLIDLVLMYLEF